MSEDTNVNIVPTESGSVIFAPDVVATIAGLAASSVEGVTGMSGNVTDGIADLLGFKNLTKGVKVDLGREETIINVNIVVRYGLKIHEVSKEVQDAVKDAVETMTGLKVIAVNILVQSVSFDEEPKPKKAKDKEKEDLPKLR